MPSLFCLPMACSRQVDVLDRSQNNLEAVPNEIDRFRGLEELLLAMNNISLLPKNLFRLSRLRVLDVSDNKLTVLPSEIGNLTLLNELNLNRNDITDIPEQLKNCKQLINLNLNCNPFTRLPESICEISSLVTLSLNDTTLTVLPANIGDLVNLRVLEARENLLRTIPSSIVNLEHLEELDLGQNDIEELPRDFGRLTNLRELFIDMNGLMSLPDSISNCRNLDQLDISENQINVLPAELGNMESLSDLNASQNVLQELPSSIGNLRKLAMLKVDHNAIHTLTREIGKCESLTELYLTKNYLSEIPSSIGELKSLTTLNVDENQLLEIPETIGECSSLSVLSLRKNSITSLPMSIGKCENLTVLDVASNKLKSLPFTINVLYKLQALWLSETQSQSIMKLQQQRDSRTNIKVLTCFLLPQVDETIGGYESSKEEAGNRSFLGGPKVHFHDQDSSMEDDRLQIGQFERHNTPHPKQPKHKKGSIDGHVLHHEDDQPTQIILNKTSTSSVGASSSSLIQDDIRFIDSSFTNGNTDGVRSPDREEVFSTSTSTLSLSGIMNGQNPNVKRILIRRDGSGKLGMTFAGGAQNSPAPTSDGDNGLFVTKVTPGSAAEKCGLMEGDKLIRANDRNMVAASQDDAMNAIRSSSDVVELIVLRRPSPLPRKEVMFGSQHQLSHDTMGSPDNSTMFVGSSSCAADLRTTTFNAKIGNVETT